MSTQNIGFLLIIAAIYFGYVGFQKGQPTKLESISIGMGNMAEKMAQAFPKDHPLARTSPDAKTIRKDTENVKNLSTRRATPFYLLAGVLGVGGVLLFVQKG